MDAMANITAPEPKPSFFINRNFGLLWIGQAVSDLGDMIYFVTLSLWIATIIAKDQPWAPVAVSGVLIAGALPTLAAGLHARVLGVTFGTYDTIYIVVGLLFMLGAFYAMINLRGLKVD